MNRDQGICDGKLSRQATWGDLAAEGAALQQAIRSLRPILGCPIYHVVVGEVPGTYRTDLPPAIEEEELLLELTSSVFKNLTAHFVHQAQRFTAVLLQGPSGESFGWLLVTETVDAGALRALQAAARELGESFEQAWLVRCANYDGLTRLPNRRYLERLLISGFEECQRKGEPYAIAFVDLDHFKQINDTQGHDTGDQVLREAAERLSSAVRAGDALGRWGGEEFVIGLANVNAEEARILGERLSLALGVAPMEAGVWVTASVGIATSPTHGETLAQLLREADAALYEAKDAGRNRVCLSGVQPGDSDPGGVATWLTSRDLGAVSYPLIPGIRYLLGRSIHCDLRLQDPSVSRIHAAIRVDRDGKIYLADQGSFNGVLRNERPVRRTVELRVGDRVQIGRYQLRVEASAKSLDRTLETTACRRVAVANLAKTKLEDVLASAKRREVTGWFDIAYRGGRGKISLEKGEVTSVSHGELEGEVALRSLTSLPEGLCVLS